MADVAMMDLFDVFEPDTVEDNTPKTSTGDFTPPPEDKYFGQVGMITDENFSNTGEGYLKLKLPPVTIVDGPKPGFQMKFPTAPYGLSGKKYSNRNSSGIIDFLRSCGVSQVPATAEEAKNLCKAQSGKTFQFNLQWYGRDKDANEDFMGEDKFPLVDGVRQGWRQSEVDPEKRVFANGRIRGFISAVGK